MKYRSDTRGPGRAAPFNRPKSKEPLSDSRYQDLLSRAGAFFAASERDVEGERAAVIVEILETLERHGLTVADLR